MEKNIYMENFYRDKILIAIKEFYKILDDIFHTFISDKVIIQVEKNKYYLPIDKELIDYYFDKYVYNNNYVELLDDKYKSHFYDKTDQFVKTKNDLYRYLTYRLIWYIERYININIENGEI